MKPTGLAALWLSCLLATSCAQESFVRYTIEANDGDGWMSQGFGCFAIGDRHRASSESSSGSHSVSLKTEDGALVLKVEVNGKVTEQRTFDESFAREMREETVTFEVPGGEERYHFEGAPHCGPPAPDAS